MIYDWFYFKFVIQIFGTKKKNICNSIFIKILDLGVYNQFYSKFVKTLATRILFFWLSTSFSLDMYVINVLYRWILMKVVSLDNYSIILSFSSFMIFMHILKDMTVLFQGNSNSQTECFRYPHGKRWNLPL